VISIASALAVLASPAPVAAAAPATAVTIGLFLPTRGPGAEEGKQVRWGAEIALAEANRQGGLRGRPFLLADAASDLKWEAAAGALVRLIYEEGAVAVVGALDARSAHLAEQIVTRARGQAVLVTPWASEATLTQIRIPWFFRIVPDDDRQARLLSGEIFSVRRIERVAVWVDDSLDARAAAASFGKAAPPQSLSLFGAGAEEGSEALVSRAARGEFGAVVLFASQGTAIDLHLRLRGAGYRALIAGPLRLAGPDLVREGSAAEGIVLVAPGRGDPRMLEEFERTFRVIHGVFPAPPALYGHDAVQIVIEAMRRAGTAGGKELGPALEGASVGGLTGVVTFDEHRSRGGALDLATLRAGRLEMLPGAGAPRSGGRTWR
jgi:branched-chain amino acid transport system substrate-binding protein